MIDDLLVCAVCRSDIPLAVIRDRGAGNCPSCGRRYHYRGAFDLTPIPPPDEETQQRWPLWEELQRNFVLATEAEPVASLSIGDRADARLFGEFADLRGLTLDVGCGTQPLPSYATASSGRFVGIDPLPGAGHRFDFVQGLAEFLPFRSGTFDRLLFATSLDHMLNPKRTLAEARRVLKEDGQVVIWFGVEPPVEAPPSSVQRARKAIAMLRRGDYHRFARRLAGRPGEPSAPSLSLTRPDGAIDVFHAFHVQRTVLEQWLATAHLRPSQWRSVTEHAPAQFVRCVPA